MIVAIAQVMTLVIVIIATVATVITQPILIHKMQVLMHINIKKSTIWSAFHFRFERYWNFPVLFVIVLILGILKVSF